MSLHLNENGLRWLKSERHIQIDPRKQYYIAPQRIVWETSLPHSSIENSSALLLDREKQISLNRENLCVLTNLGEPAGILLDFGQELHGGVEIAIRMITGAQTADLRIRFGESASEAMSELGGKSNATNDHSRRDLIVTVQKLSMNPIGETGFRFVRIDLLTSNVSVSIRTVKAVAVLRDIPYLGSFNSSDPLLNRIWDVGAYTVHLNMQQYIWDGIKRDRLVWIGDLHPEIATIQTVFGNQHLIQDTLDFAVQETPAGGWINNIPAYSMWWIIIQYDYFMQYGDLAYLERQIPYLEQVCNMLSSYIDANGKDITPEMRFVDWPTRRSPAATDLGLQALHILAVKRAAELFDIFGRMRSAAQCREDCTKLCSFPINMCDSKQANALAAWAGLFDAETVNEKSLRSGGAEGLSAFMGYYILQTRAEAGDIAGALDVIRDYWGGMLHLGATTFWEDFDLKWLENASPIDRLPQENEIDVHATYGGYCYQGFRHSLCHGWSSGPTSWLTKYILGVNVLEPGCKKLQIKPELCDLQWVSGTYPTPEGVVEITHRRREDGTIQTTICAPPSIEVTCKN